MSDPETNQPDGKPQMTTKPSEHESVVKAAGTEYVKGAAGEGGEQTVDYLAENGQDQLDDAKAQAQGLWAKYCGCFGSAA